MHILGIIGFLFCCCIACYRSYIAEENKYIHWEGQLLLTNICLWKLRKRMTIWKKRIQRLLMKLYKLGNGSMYMRLTKAYTFWNDWLNDLLLSWNYYFFQKGTYIFLLHWIMQKITKQILPGFELWLHYFIV